LRNGRQMIKRLMRFNAVGAMGVLVQAAMLAFFMRAVGLHYMAATALAVESAVLHNLDRKSVV
jgi:putative flippase GtrA